ncbi:hypothetical protein H7I87_18355 [Mycobacterium timonense]|uniref:Uncharacterized protein n=2 Tax=Mycobacterium avium complex (MAC) TaxID=120793 RepID=A0AAW5SB12_MYCBC|nr:MULTISPECIES: hypothetical protein [Mycobacterium avium complex (MAC)]EUA38441.1 hypothetical protein I549_1924 [Mycobacterium avium subsp. avium 2285 (R)]MCV6991809.1 hypothetical protein [Mycobacterium bouchedurhonense]MCV6996646.1 hypothetical protein [Mycobacterium timonense]ORA42072.1 hypothetical protein BST19_26480 [Mycobacterium bouchedurhonense]ORB77060.1 hypothetical protein BST46_26650 [Mycobacterium timonense]
MDEKFESFIAAATALMRRAEALPIVAANAQASQRIAAAITDVSKMRHIDINDPKLLVEVVDGKLGEVQDALATAKASSR